MGQTPERAENVTAGKALRDRRGRTANGKEKDTEGRTWPEPGNAAKLDLFENDLLTGKVDSDRKSKKIMYPTFSVRNVGDFVLRFSHFKAGTGERKFPRLEENFAGARAPRLLWNRYRGGFQPLARRRQRGCRGASSSEQPFLGRETLQPSASNCGRNLHFNLNPETLKKNYCLRQSNGECFPFHLGLSFTKLKDPSSHSRLSPDFLLFFLRDSFITYQILIAL